MAITAMGVMRSFTYVTRYCLKRSRESQGYSSVWGSQQEPLGHGAPAQQHSAREGEGEGRGAPASAGERDCYSTQMTTLGGGAG